METFVRKMASSLPLLLAALAMISLWQSRETHQDWRFASPDYGAGQIDAPAELRSDFASHIPDQFVHAASVTALDDGSLLASWFGGSREGARDVNIFAARYDPQTRTWNQEQVLQSRDSTERATKRTIRKLGNPVVSLAPDGKLWLFYVSVSVGGWAGSAINASFSLDNGVNWSTPRRLITSPFLNISTLVKGTPVYYQDGAIGLPVYHEFLGKFAELLYLSADGEVLDKIRISQGKHSLQPVISPANATSATALMRYAGSPPKRVLASRTTSSGKTWTTPHKTALANSNSALSVVRLDDGSLLGVMNDLEDGRHRLSLMRSIDEGDSWQRLSMLEGHDDAGGRLPIEDYLPILEQDFQRSVAENAAERWALYRQSIDERVCEDGSCRFIYDYPYLIRARGGQFHLVYTWNKSYIKHLQFNQSWLDELL